MDTATVKQPLTTNIGLVTAAVSAITVEPGGAQPEASDEALRLVVNGSSACGTGSIGTFRTECFKIIVLATDAQPGGCDDVYADGVDDVNAIARANDAKNKGIIILPILVQGNPFASPAHPGGVVQSREQ